MRLTGFSLSIENTLEPANPTCAHQQVAAVVAKRQSVDRGTHKAWELSSIGLQSPRCMGKTTVRPPMDMEAAAVCRTGRSGRLAGGNRMIGGNHHTLGRRLDLPRRWHGVHRANRARGSVQAWWDCSKEPSAGSGEVALLQLSRVPPARTMQVGFLNSRVGLRELSCSSLCFGLSFARGR